MYLSDLNLIISIQNSLTKEAHAIYEAVYCYKARCVHRKNFRDRNLLQHLPLIKSYRPDI